MSEYERLRIDHAIGGDTLSEVSLRRMNHKEWLAEFAQVMAHSPNAQPSEQGTFRGMPMTPFRAGIVTRLERAARYIALLEREIAELTAKPYPAPGDPPPAGGKLDG